MGSLLGFLAEQQVSHDDPFYVNNAVEGLTGIDTTLWDSPLESVSYTMDLDVDPVPLWVQLGFVALTATGLALLAVFPVGESVRWVRAPQLFGAFWIAGWLALLSRVRSGAEFVMPDHGACLQVDCWPLGYQELVIAAPLALAAVVLAAMAFFPRLAWQTQAFVPTGVYLTLALLQRALWDVHLLPLLSTAPPG